jgi:general secretion pathway protein N
MSKVRLMCGVLSVCAIAHGADATQVHVAALDSGPRPGLGDIEQFPITPRELTPPPPGIAQAPQSQPQTGNPLWAVPLRTLSATRERPIFSPSRRPPPAAVAIAPAAPPPLAPPPPAVPERPSLALVGTVTGEGERIAIFYNTATRATIRLRLGETDDTGWKLVAVDARTTLLEKGRESVTLALPTPDESAGAANGGGIPGLGIPGLGIPARGGTGPDL